MRITIYNVGGIAGIAALPSDAGQIRIDKLFYSGLSRVKRRCCQSGSEQGAIAAHLRCGAQIVVGPLDENLFPRPEQGKWVYT